MELYRNPIILENQKVLLLELSKGPCYGQNISTNETPSDVISGIFVCVKINTYLPRRKQ